MINEGVLKADVTFHFLNEMMDAYTDLPWIVTSYTVNSEKAMAPHSSTLAWKIPWVEEPGRLQSMGSLRIGHDWVTSLSLFTFMHWVRKWQPTPVFLPGESQGRGCLVGCHLWSRTESDMTEATQQQQQQQRTVNSRMNSGSWWWTGRPGCCDSWRRKKLDTTEWLNWLTDTVNIL